MGKTIGLLLVIASTWGLYLVADHYFIPEPQSMVSVMTPPPVPISSLEEATASADLAQSPTPYPVGNYRVAIDTDAASEMAGYAPEVVEKLMAVGFRDLNNVHQAPADQALTEVVLAPTTNEAAFELIVQALSSEYDVVKKEGGDVGEGFDVRILLGRKRE